MGGRSWGKEIKVKKGSEEGLRGGRVDEIGSDKKHFLGS